jgi:TorA maturation chaperone TorD
VVRKTQQAEFDRVAPEAGPQDHIGAELRFMSLLCYRESRAWGGGDRALAESLRANQMRFLDDHLLQWVPGYCEALSQAAAEPLYEGLAQMTRDALAEDRRVLDELRLEVDRS